MAKKRAKDAKPLGAPAGDTAGGDGGCGGAAGTGASPRIPIWLPASVFGALTLWLFRDFVFSDRMLLGNDTLSLGYVARAFYAEALKQM